MYIPEDNSVDIFTFAYQRNHWSTKYLIGIPRFYNPVNKKHWDQMWMDARAKTIPSYERVVSAYSEPHRKYHTLEHIRSMFYLFNDIRIRKWLRNNLPKNSNSFHELLVMRFAIWYHDIVENVHRSGSDNIKASIDIAVTTIIEATGSQTLAEDVTGLINVSDYSKTVEQLSVIQKLFVDIDLAIFGQHPINYRTYSKQIREEYIHYPDDEYKIGRSKVLKVFLEKKPIFQTDLFRDILEERAIKNINEEIKRLGN